MRCHFAGFSGALATLMAIKIKQYNPILFIIFNYVIALLTDCSAAVPSTARKAGGHGPVDGGAYASVFVSCMRLSKSI